MLDNSIHSSKNIHRYIYYYYDYYHHGTLMNIPEEINNEMLERLMRCNSISMMPIKWLIRIKPETLQCWELLRQCVWTFNHCCLWLSVAYWHHTALCILINPDSGDGLGLWSLPEPCWFIINDIPWHNPEYNLMENVEWISQWYESAGYKFPFTITFFHGLIWPNMWQHE